VFVLVLFWLAAVQDDWLKSVAALGPRKGI
jgi:hypothetical protein